LNNLDSNFWIFHEEIDPNDHSNLCQKASEQVQQYLSQQQEWTHNFGLDPSQTSMVIGKMFGVLVVTNQQDELGFLVAFSGKLAGGNHHRRFVPPVYDMLQPDGFFVKASIPINRLNDQIKELEIQTPCSKHHELIRKLKIERKQRSHQLQQKIFDHYEFLNSKGETKSLRQLFLDADAGAPPAGAGECAAPKLLQYSYQNGYRPMAMAEFWWGTSPKSEQREHGEFYPACKEKCGPILRHMLGH
jgi:tRNA pseudouridine32 synthase/23S rRNA pseudouridine746 synthase